MTSDELDVNAAITAAARSVVGRDPSPAFHARLSRRLEVPRRWRWQLVAVPAAAAIATAVALRPATTTPVLPPVASAMPRVAVPIQALPLPDPSLPWATLATTSPVTTSLPDRSALAPPLSEVEAAWAADAVPALAEPLELVVAATQPEAMSVPLLNVGELVAPPLSLRPLGLTRAPR